ncbi:MAG: AraC family transcriptional regulator [Bermanella sp.]
MAAQSSYSTISSWMSSVHRVLLDENIDADALFAKSGVSLEYVHKQDLRVGVDEARQVWREAVLATGDDAFGLKVAKALLEFSLDPVTLAIESSSTLGEAMTRFIKFYQVVSNGVLIYQERGITTDVVLTTKGNTQLPAQEAVDAAIAIMVIRMQSLASPGIDPVRVEFIRQRPKNLKAFTHFYNCDLYFGCENNRICYPLVLENQPLVKANASLSVVLDEYLDKAVKEIAMQPFTLKVSEVVNKLLFEGEVDLTQVAGNMGLGVRSLQRHLKEENTSFKEIIEACKLATAKRLLTKDDQSVTDIAFLLGFSSPSNFVRFFKRLEGISPGEFQSGV